MKILLTILVLAVTLAGCPSTFPTMLPQPRALVADGTDTHRASRVAFSEAVAKFGRTKVMPYDDLYTIEKRALHTGLYLFTFGKWALKYRFIYPPAAEACASTAIRDFLLAFTWPSPL